MASKTGFKQQCPHCEAMVPIKDESLIGKRIRCPKCNEPFRVEDTEGAAATTKTAKPAKSASGGSAATKAKSGAKRTPVDEDDQPKFKKKKGDSNKLLIGLGLAGVAVVLLVVTVIIVMNNQSTTKPTNNPSNSVASRSSTPEPDKSTQPEEKPAQQISFASLSNITNMLPSQTQAVINLPMSVIKENPLGNMMFVNNLGASTKDAGRMGFALEDVKQWIIALSYSEPVWYFHIIRTTKPIQMDILKKNLRMQPAAGGPIKGQDYYVTNVNWTESSKLLPAYLKPSGDPDSAGGGGSHPLFVRLHDPLTLVIADQFPMKRFLEEKGQFPPQAALPADLPGKNSPFGNFPGVGNPGAPRGAPPGARGAPPGAAPAEGPHGKSPGAKNSAPVSVGNYRTINPRLKLMLDRVEANSPYLGSAAVDLEGNQFVSFLATIYLGLKGKFQTAGFSFQWKEDNRMVAMAAVECDSDQAANSLRQGVDKKVQPYYDKLWFIPPTYTFRVKKGREKPPDLTPGGPNAGRPGQLPGERPGRNPGFPPGGPPRDEPGPGNPSQPNKPQEIPAGVQIHLDLTSQGRWVNLAADFNSQDQIRNDVLQLIEPYLVRLQGEFEMGRAQPNPRHLAGAVLQFAEKDGVFPRGTTEYRKPAASRAGRDWAPDQRVSWMAELLPYLGYGQVSDRIRRDLSWRDEENLTPGSVLIPNFLAPGSLKSTWYVSYPGLAPEMAATHFVGMAGVGLDAANYPPDHPDAGIFNYNRRTPLARVADKSRTVLMIQVPPGFPSPWIAGGGSTIRGVPQTKSIQPFLNLNENRERGTTVLMADGSVRWVSEKISDDVFKAMCRLKGNKENVNLSQMKLLPLPEDQPELTATPAAPSAAPKPEVKKAAPPPPKAAPAAPKPVAPPAATKPKPGAPPGSK